MIVELTPEQRDLLLRLVNIELDEIGPEIRHSFRGSVREELRDERRQLGGLRDLLGDVPAASDTEPTAVARG